MHIQKIMSQQEGNKNGLYRSHFPALEDEISYNKVSRIVAGTPIQDALNHILFAVTCQYFVSGLSS